MKASGKMTRPTAKEGLFMLTETHTMGNGSTINLMATVCMSIRMELNTRGFGKRINNMVQVS